MRNSDYATVHPNISIPRLADGQMLNIQLTQRNKLGNGSFGSAYAVNNFHHPQKMVCKIVNLDGISKNIHFSHHQLLRLTYREIAYLQKVDMLIGYYHDAANKHMIILMNHIQGPTECELDKDFFPNAEYASFAALRRLHRLGIAHMDPHDSNFIYDYALNNAQAIDFGLAQNYQIFRGLRDFYVFLKKRNNSSSLMSERGLDSVSHVFNFYCLELKNYILSNRLECAKALFYYAAVVIAALSGASVLGVASLIAQQLIVVELSLMLSQLLEALQDHYELRAWNQHHVVLYRAYYGFLTGILVVMQGFLTALQISNIATSAQTIFWQGYLNGLPILELSQIVLGLKPLVHACQYWQNTLEKYFACDTYICQKYRQTIEQVAHPKPLLPLFQCHLSETPQTVEPPNIPLSPQASHLSGIHPF
jgi:tRNA A-37 threonylcarbamoyl transferase component Bud32